MPTSQEEAREQLIANFNNINAAGFEELMPFQGSDIGFSVNKPYKDTGNISLIKVALRDRVNLQEENGNDQKALYVSAAYGKLSDNKRYLEAAAGKRWLRPVDIQSIDDYRFDLSNGKIYKDGIAISGKQLLNGFYETHVKSTKLIRGARIRFRLWFWTKFLRKLFIIVSEPLSWLLLIISGTRYTYDPFATEIPVAQPDLPQHSVLKKKEGETFEFFGYKASRWSVVFYCAASLAIYTITFYLNWRPGLLKGLLGNTFLVTCYVVVSLWLIEDAVPRMLKFFIEYFGRVADELSFKKISINIR